MGALVAKIFSLRGETKLSRESNDWAKIKLKRRFNYMKGTRVGKERNISDNSIWVLFRYRLHLQKNLTENNLRQGLKESTG